MEARSPFRFYNAYLARKPCESHCVSLPTAGAWGSGASNTTLALRGCMAFTARPAPALRVSQLCTLADLIVPAFNPSPFSLQYTRPPPSPLPPGPACAGRRRDHDAYRVSPVGLHLCGGGDVHGPDGTGPAVGAAAYRTVQTNLQLLCKPRKVPRDEWRASRR